MAIAALPSARLADGGVCGRRGCAAGLHGSGISFEKACACNPNGWPNNPKVAPGDQANHCCDLKPGPPPPSDPHLEKGRCSFLYETIEGGPQDDERWRQRAQQLLEGVAAPVADIGQREVAGATDAVVPLGSA